MVPLPMCLAMLNESHGAGYTPPQGCSTTSQPRPRCSLDARMAATAHLATFNLTAFVFIVQEYGRKHVGELAEGQGEGQGEWQGGLYSIVQE